MNTHLKQLWAAMKLPEKLQKRCKFFCRGLDIRVVQVVETDTLHLVCYQKIWEMLAQEIGPNPLSHRVYIKTQLGARTFNKTANRRGLSAQAAVWNNSLVSSIIFSKF